MNFHAYQVMKGARNLLGTHWLPLWAEAGWWGVVAPNPKSVICPDLSQRLNEPDKMKTACPTEDYRADGSWSWPWKIIKIFYLLIFLQKITRLMEDDQTDSLDNETWPPFIFFWWKTIWLMRDNRADVQWPDFLFMEDDLKDGRWHIWWKTTRMIEDNLADWKQSRWQKMAKKSLTNFK